MACECEFPQRVPMACVWDLIRIVRRGELITERSEALRHVGCILGATGNMMVATGPIVFGSRSDQTLDEICSQLETMEDAVGASSVIDNDLLMLLINLSWKVVEWLVGRGA